MGFWPNSERNKTTITKVNNEDLIYAAGFLDGEGCFEILGTAKKASIRIKMMNSYRPVVEWFQKTIGGTFKDVGIMSVKPIYSWYVSGDNAYNFCIQLLPYLKEKKPQAQCVIDFRDLGTFSRYNLPTQEVVEQRQALKTKIRSLKIAHY